MASSIDNVMGKHTIEEHLNKNDGAKSIKYKNVLMLEPSSKEMGGDCPISSSHVNISLLKLSVPFDFGKIYWLVTKKCFTSFAV